MKRLSTFSQLFLLVLALIVGVVLLLTSVFYFSFRKAQTENHVAALKSEARDVAFLAGQTPTGSGLALNTLTATSTQQLMERKLRDIHSNYDAFCFVVDRTFNVTAYFLSVVEAHPELSKTLDTTRLVDTLNQVLNGEEVFTEVPSPNGPLFTVAVPWVKDGRVTGAVLVQTAAQRIRAGYTRTVLAILGIALLCSAIAAGILYVVTRRFLKPISNISHAARRMGAGHYEPVDVTGTAEVQDLALSFNAMGSQLDNAEVHRRELIANLSHELRSPLTSIKGFAEGMLDGTVPDDDRERSLRIISDEASRLNKLVNGLLNLSYLQSDQYAPKMVKCDINELIRRSVIAQITSLEKKGVSVNFDFAQDPMNVSADIDQIEQVVINLVSNAGKYAPQNGNITIRTSREDANRVLIRIEDDGPGVSPQDVPHLFERFFQGDRSHSHQDSTGLGLAISASILQKHGERVWYEPMAHGACFCFTLRAAE